MNPQRFPYYQTTRLGQPNCPDPEASLARVPESPSFTFRQIRKNRSCVPLSLHSAARKLVEQIAGSIPEMIFEN